MFDKVMSNKSVMKLFVWLGGLCVSLSCAPKDMYFYSLPLVPEEPVAQTSLLEETPPVVEKEEVEKEEKEIFTLKQNQPLVDILVVVDSSKSMYHHLNKLGRSLSSLLSVIHNYDWQMAFISVDHGDNKSSDHLIRISVQQKWQNHLTSKEPSYGRLMRLDDGQSLLKATILTKKQDNYEDIFYHTLSHIPEINCSRSPYCSGGLEQPLRSLKAAIERQQVDNASFFRPKADLVTLIITNEDERMGDETRATQAQEVLDVFHQVFQGLNKQFINFNIMIKDNQCRAKELRKGQIASIGKAIGKLSVLTGGENIDICSADYSNELEKISHHIKFNLENSLVLKNQPVPQSVRIDFKGSNKIPWSLVDKKITFKGKIKSDTSVSVYYKMAK